MQDGETFGSFCDHDFLKNYVLDYQIARIYHPVVECEEKTTVS
jgi:hypothetical protein